MWSKYATHGKEPVLKPGRLAIIRAKKCSKNVKERVVPGDISVTNLTFWPICFRIYFKFLCKNIIDSWNFQPDETSRNHLVIERAHRKLKRYHVAHMKISGYKQNYTGYNIPLVLFGHVCEFCIRGIAIWLIHGTILRESG